ncbi:hypothetical protein [Cellvibrio sp. PSBB023]|uniref:hypothetical protein n=1 Tax=Cellvibrio sp. PSBB023 TaxID=1945512 RepID=UPI001FED6F43|nr:hypothetical protein [Cellvibrio sp. PSBB023]
MHTLMPVVFVPHGGGPMPLLGDVNHRELTRFMQSLAADLPRPQAIVVITAHWEEELLSISDSPAPGMMFDYYGFPPESYEFSYPAPVILPLPSRYNSYYWRRISRRGWTTSVATTTVPLYR